MYNCIGIKDLDIFLVNNSTNVLLLYFGATWCGPCSQLKQRFAQPDIPQIFKNLALIYIDVDINENLEIIELYKIEALPTLIFIKLESDNVCIKSRLEGYDFNRILIEYNNY